MDLGLEENTAIVTASTSGLGKASAASLLREGADVAICGRTADQLESARAELATAGQGEVVAVQADITDPEALEGLVTTTLDRFGGIDHLVTSAGGVPAGDFHEVERGAWSAAFELLVTSFVRTTELTVPHLRESDAGTIVAITSASVIEPIDQLVLSNSVRRSVHGLVKSLAREFAPDVRVNSVLPSLLVEDAESEIDEALASGEYERREAVIADWTSELPLERIGDPTRLGDMVAFLSSNRTAHTTGAAIPVDGGRIRS